MRTKFSYKGSNPFSPLNIEHECKQCGNYGHKIKQCEKGPLPKNNYHPKKKLAQ